MNSLLDPDDAANPFSAHTLSSRAGARTLRPGSRRSDDRRVGSNEVTAIYLLRAYVDARLNYTEPTATATRCWNTRRIVSTAGQEDGLY